MPSSSKENLAGPQRTTGGSSQLAAIDGNGGGGASAFAIGMAGNESKVTGAAATGGGTVEELAPVGPDFGTAGRPAPVKWEDLGGLSLDDSLCRDRAAKLS